MLGVAVRQSAIIRLDQSLAWKPEHRVRLLGLEVFLAGARTESRSPGVRSLASQPPSWSEVERQGFLRSVGTPVVAFEYC